MSEEIWSGNEGYLYVYVSKAKDLPNLIKLDKQNVMLRLRVAHMTRESDVKFRAGQNPIFNYLEKFEITPSVKPIMYVEVYCDRKKKAPIAIGRCAVDLMNGICADPKDGYCTWYDLKRNDNEFAGTIFIELTFKPSLKRNCPKKVDKNTLKLDTAVAARPIPPLPTGSRNVSSVTTIQNMERTVNNSKNLQSNTPQYMHASEMRQVTPLVRNINYGSDNFNGVNVGHENVSSSSSSNKMPDINLSPSKYNGYECSKDFEANQFRVQNFASSVNTNTTMSSQDTSSTTVTSTSAETRFHFANLKKLKERINIFKNPNISSEKDSRQDEIIGSLHTKNNIINKGVDIEALEKAIGVTSVEEDDEKESYIRNRVANKHDSYKQPTLHADRNYRQSTRVSGSRKNSDRISLSKHNLNAHFPHSLGNASFSKSPRLDMKLPPLPNERMAPKLKFSKIPQLPNIPIELSSHRNRTHSVSPIRKPSSPTRY